MIPNSASSTVGAFALSPASGSQQTLLISNTYVDSAAVGVSYPMSVMIALICQNLSQQAPKTLLPTMISDVVDGGSNATFSLKPSTPLNSSTFYNLDLHVFLISPTGVLVATFPPKDALVETQAGTNAVGFKNPSYSPKETQVINALASGTPRFTYPIPASDASVGVWKVYAFLVSSSSFQIAVQPIAVGAASFEVPQPSSLPAPLQTTWNVFQFLASWAFIAGIAKFAIDKYPGDWVRKNWPLVLGVILMAIYLTLRLLVF